MLNGSLYVLVILVAILSGAVVGYIVKQIFSAKKIKASESLAARIVEEAKKESETIKKEAMLQAKESLLKMKGDFDRETKDKKNDLDGLERRIRTKEENMDKRIDLLAAKETNIDGREKSISSKEAAIEDKHRKLDGLMEGAKRKAAEDSRHFLGGGQKNTDPIHGSGCQTRCRSQRAQNRRGSQTYRR